MSESNLVPVGNYRARAVSSEKVWIVSKNGGKGAEVECQITSGPYQGRTVMWRGYLGAEERDDQVERVLRQLKIAGCNLSTLEDVSGLGSTEFGISVVHEDYEVDGEKRTIAKVNWINAGSNSKPLDAGKLAGMKAKFAGMLAKLNAGQSSSESKDDNIPF